MKKFQILSNDVVFQLSQHAEIEFINDHVLVFNARRRSLEKFDHQASRFLTFLDGQTTLSQLSTKLAPGMSMTEEQALSKIQEVSLHLLHLGIIQPIHNSWKGIAMNTLRYVVNPDVNLREEDDDGALLYNPDMDRVQLLNTTGLYIWKLCHQERTSDEIISALQVDFDEVPSEVIVADVDEFLTQMVDGGFIGTL